MRLLDGLWVRLFVWQRALTLRTYICIDQLCGELRSGFQGAVHAMNDLFTQHNDYVPGWGAMLVDATNAFNSWNNSTLLWNACVLWNHCSFSFLILIGVGLSSLFVFLLNTYSAERVLHRVIRYQCFSML